MDSNAESLIVGMRLRIRILPEQTGGYVADCPELPGAVARGMTWDETLQAIEEQIRAVFAEHLEQAISAARRDLHEPLSPQAVALEFAFSPVPAEDGAESYGTVA